MLLPWRDSVYVFLQPQQVVMVRMAAGWKKRVVSKQTLPCNVEGKPSWTSALATLKKAMLGADWQKAQVRVVLSNQFVSYTLIPWTPQIVGGRELDGYVRHCFQQRFEEAAKKWDLRISHGGFDAPSLSSGVDAELLQQIREVFSGSTLKLVSIQPLLMSAYNQLRHQIKSNHAWFVLVEAGTLCIGLLNDGHWRSLRSLSINADWVQDFDRIIAREEAICGVDAKDAPVHFYCLERPSQQLETTRSLVRLAPSRVDGLIVQDNPCYRLAAW